MEAARESIGQGKASGWQDGVIVCAGGLGVLASSTTLVRSQGGDQGMEDICQESDGGRRSRVAMGKGEGEAQSC